VVLIIYIIKKMFRVKTMFLKEYLIYMSKHLPAWLFIMLISLTALYIVTSLSYPRTSEKIVVEGVERVTKVAEKVSNIKKNVSMENKTIIEKQVNLWYAALIIYLNNLKVNLLFAIPLAGAVFYAYALTYNAWVIRYLGASLFGPTGYIDFLVKLLGEPHTYLELLAYSIVVTESSYIGYKLLFTRDATRRDILYYLFSLLISNIILCIAAYIEVMVF